ncbi:MAG TPA: ATPase, T2SS/T4P/T4SS family, partial [Gemmataceae bacterium]|nr:ATPase, T2SS/T4P/T4SS family [Gemmataceae bacterium]
MATPNDPIPPKKPQGPLPGKPAQPPAAGTPGGQKPPPQGVPQRPAVPQGGPAKPPPQQPPKPGSPPAGTPAQKPPLGKLVSSGDKPAVPQKPAAPKPVGDKTPAAADKKPAAGAKPPPAKIPAKPGAGPSAKNEPRSAKAAQSRGGRKLGQVLVDLGFIDDSQLWEMLDEGKSSGVPIGQVAVSRGLISEDQLFQALADQFGLKTVNLQEVKIQPEALTLVPETMASVYKVLPLSCGDGTLTVVIGDPANLPACDDLRNFLGIKEVTAVLAPATAIADFMTKAYAGKEESILDIINALETDPELSDRREGSIDLESLMEIQDAAPVRKLLNMVMLLAIKDHASDIHFEPFEDEYKLRYRKDGVLYELIPPPRHLAMAIASRIKVMANLDIAERRMPQDGRIELNVGGNSVDMRVSILPTMFGESVVIRVLDRTNLGLDLNKVGMDATVLATFRELIHKPNGIMLVTGPTGSGKTTTLYSALNELNEITEKIITTEDPVEYDIDGIIQVQINHEIGLDFASALRSILRQDPDKILVGEIRDLETSQIAVQAALTGHMVFSTLHTNDAP